MTQTQVVDEKQALASLTQHPGWAVLAGKWTELQAEKERETGERFVRLRVTADQRELDRLYGFWKGVRAVLGDPGKAETLLRELEKETP